MSLLLEREKKIVTVSLHTYYHDYPRVTHLHFISFCIESLVIVMVKFVRKDRGGGGKLVYLYILSLHCKDRRLSPNFDGFPLTSYQDGRQSEKLSQMWCMVALTVYKTISFSELLC